MVLCCSLWNGESYLMWQTALAGVISLMIWRRKCSLCRPWSRKWGTGSRWSNSFTIDYFTKDSSKLGKLGQRRGWSQIVKWEVGSAFAITDRQGNLNLYFREKSYLTAHNLKKKRPLKGQVRMEHWSQQIDHNDELGMVQGYVHCGGRENNNIIVSVRNMQEREKGRRKEGRKENIKKEIKREIYIHKRGI